jgi:hypothetical protein
MLTIVYFLHIKFCAPVSLKSEAQACPRRNPLRPQAWRGRFSSIRVPGGITQPTGRGGA